MNKGIEFRQVVELLSAKQQEAVRLNDVESVRTLSLAILILTTEFTKEATTALLHTLVLGSPELSQILPDVLKNEVTIGIVDAQLKVLRLGNEQFKLNLNDAFWKTLELFFQNPNYKIDTHPLILSRHFTDISNVYNHISGINKALKEAGLHERGIQVTNTGAAVGVYELTFPGKRYITQPGILVQTSTEAVVTNQVEEVRNPEPKQLNIVGTAICDQDLTILFDTKSEKRMNILRYLIERAGTEISREELIEKSGYAGQPDSNFSSIFSRLREKVRRSEVLSKMVRISDVKRQIGDTKREETFYILRIVDPTVSFVF